MMGDRHAGEINSASHPSAGLGCCAGGSPLFVESVLLSLCHHRAGAAVTRRGR
ncbi:hypothetical protein BJX68DRAFT_246714 [Aspergillus pseudodeflectus]|uniref:Uncharacterized protein n=1 Tax=Aspergillus pseudodeflectus TaxID=176178 RepID=A0ABR4JK00_9EURO